MDRTKEIPCDCLGRRIQHHKVNKKTPGFEHMYPPDTPAAEHWALNMHAQLGNLSTLLPDLDCTVLLYSFVGIGQCLRMQNQLGREYKTLNQKQWYRSLGSIDSIR